MAKIGPSDLGQRVNEYFQPTNAVKYHNDRTGTTTDVQKLNGKLVGLAQIRKNPGHVGHETTTRTAQWKDCSPSVKADLKSKFDIDSPPPSPMPVPLLPVGFSTYREQPGVPGVSEWLEQPKQPALGASVAPPIAAPSTRPVAGTSASAVTSTLRPEAREQVFRGLQSVQNDLGKLIRNLDE